MKKTLILLLIHILCLSTLANPILDENNNSQTEEEPPIELGEITIEGKIVTRTEGGFVYTMAANQRAQAENALQALSYVPLVEVDALGNISVNGNPTYSIYVNGRPNELAQSSPKVFLESLSASDILRVEVITNPGPKFGGDVAGCVINIILRQPAVDGYSVNINGGGFSRPSANGSLTGMMTKGKVDMSIEYDYNYDGQRHQPLDNTLTETNISGDKVLEWHNKAQGNGDWHTHLLRALVKFNIDSLNTLYGDVHGKILRTNYENTGDEETILYGVNSSERNMKSRSNFTTGAVEANLIYRNYYKDDKDAERWTIGYGYTYNPDRRRINQLIQLPEEPPYIFDQNSDGGLNTHNILVSWLGRLKYGQFIKIIATDRIRFGHTSSSYTVENDFEIPTENSMKYKNNIGSLEFSYSKYWNKASVSLGVKGEMDYLSMKLQESSISNYHKTNFYLLPKVTFYWRAPMENTFFLDYVTSLTRPDIELLNPFVSYNNEVSNTQGNPELKAQYDHNVSLTWFFTKVKNLTCALSLYNTYSHNIILSDYLYSDHKLISSYSNFDKATQLQGIMYIQYMPLKWLSLGFNGQIGKRWVDDKTFDKTYASTTLNLTPKVDFYLPYHFRIGGKYGYYKSLSDPFCKNWPFSLYSFYLNKSFLDGRLFLSVIAESPFSKYTHRQKTVLLPGVESVHNNYITARSFGISVTYTFTGGKRVDIQRDRTLKANDQNIGIQ